MNNVVHMPKKQTDPRDGLEYPEWLDHDLWEDFLESKSWKEGRPIEKMSPKALKMILNKLKRAPQMGHDPHEMLREAIEREWKSVFYNPSTRFKERGPGHN